MEEKCSCCGKSFEEKINWHFKIPDVGYGSIFDRVDPEKPISMTICSSCFENMNRWLKKTRPKLNLQDFWRFEIVDKSQEYSAPDGYIREIKYEEDLYELIMKFMPDIYFDENSNFIRKWICRFRSYIWKKAKND